MSTVPSSVQAMYRQRYRARLLRMDMLGVLAVVSAAMALTLYVVTGQPFEVKDLGGVLTAVGIGAGLVASDLVLVMLVLAARIPLIDRVFGHDHAIALHRKLGKPVLYLLLAHGVFLTLGYASSDGRDVVAETISLFTTLENLPYAYLGLGLFIVVVVTSLVVVRRRLPYEGWHLIHLLSYAAVGFALPHQLTAGGVIVSGSFAYYYWVTLYVVALGSILVFRFILPVYYSLRHGLRVESVEYVGRGVVSINLSGRDLTRLNVLGGQYAIWRFWTRGTWWHAHPISFSAVPTDSHARITVRVLGSGTDRLTRLPVGTFVSLEGPYGIFTERARTAPNLVVIAAGIGITPMRSLLEHTPVRPGELSVLLRASSADEKYLWDEVEQLVKDHEGRLHMMIGPRPANAQSWVSAQALRDGVRVRDMFPRLLDSDVYICGPGGWTKQVEKDILRWGVPPEQVHVERFDL